MAFCLRARNTRKGNAIIEFASVMTFIILPLFFGVVRLGITMGRYTQAVQVGRDVAHLYSNGVDFTQVASQSIVTQQLAAGVGMTNTGGNGVVILSKVKTIYQADCTAAAITPCTNLNQPVFIQRITFGNTALQASSYGTPSSNSIDSAGNIPATIYCSNSDANVRAVGFETALDSAYQRAIGTAPTPPVQPQGDVIYLVEIIFQYPDLGFLGPTGNVRTSFLFH